MTCIRSYFNIVICIIVTLMTLFITMTTHAQANVNLQSVIDDAVKSGAGEVTLPAGVYRVAADGRTKAALTIRDAKNLSIDARDVKLIVTTLDQGIKLIQCENVTLTGITVDHDPLPFTQGVVTTVDEQGLWFDVRLDEGYPPAVTARSRVIIYDPTTRNVKPETWTRYGASIAPVTGSDAQPGLVRVTSVNPIRDALAVGDLASISLPTKTPHGIILEKCTNVTLEDVTVHTSTSFAIFERDGNANRYIRCQVTPGPAPIENGSPRLLASLADGFHSKFAVRGPLVRGCLFERMGDDGIAINGDFALVVAMDGDKAIIAGKRNIPFQTGDRLRGLNRDGIPTHDVKVKAMTPAPAAMMDEARRVGAQHYPQLRQATNFFEKPMVVELDPPLALEPGWVVCSPDRTGTGFHLADNMIRHHRARGILLKASQGIIEGNSIEGSSMGGIVLCPEMRFWMEADYSHDVVIRGNTLRHVQYAVPNPDTAQAGAISVTSDVMSPAGGHQRITIENNAIENSRGVQVLVTSASDVTIRGNRFISSHNLPGGPGTRLNVDPSAVIWLHHVQDVKLEDNTIEGMGPHGKLPVIASPTAINVQGLTEGIKSIK